MDKLTVGICFQCRHPLAESGLLESHTSDMAVLRSMKCSTCGAEYTLTQRLTAPSTLTAEQLTERMNVNR